MNIERQKKKLEKLEKTKSAIDKAFIADAPLTMKFLSLMTSFYDKKIEKLKNKIWGAKAPHILFLWTIV